MTDNYTLSTANYTHGQGVSTLSHQGSNTYSSTLLTYLICQLVRSAVWLIYWILRVI